MRLEERDEPLPEMYMTLCFGCFILRFRVYDVDTKFQNSREEVIANRLPAFSFYLMVTFIQMSIPICLWLNMHCSRLIRKKNG